MSFFLIIMGALGLVGMFAAQGGIIYGKRPVIWTIVMLAAGGAGVSLIGMGVSKL